MKQKTVSPGLSPSSPNAPRLNLSLGELRKNMSNQQPSTLWRDILICALGAIASLGGVMLSGTMELNRENNTWTRSYKNEILEKRIEIIDRTAKIFGKSPGISELWGKHLKDVFSHNENKIDKDLTEKLTEYQGEFQSVIYLASMYFGPKTNSALTGH